MGIMSILPWGRWRRGHSPGKYPSHFCSPEGHTLRLKSQQREVLPLRLLCPISLSLSFIFPLSVLGLGGLFHHLLDYLSCCPKISPLLLNSHHFDQKGRKESLYQTFSWGKLILEFLNFFGSFWLHNSMWDSTLMVGFWVLECRESISAGKLEFWGVVRGQNRIFGIGRRNRCSLFCGRGRGIRGLDG